MQPTAAIPTRSLQCCSGSTPCCSAPPSTLAKYYAALPESLYRPLYAQSASVILHDEGTQEVELTTTYGPPPAFHTLRYPLAGSLTGWVAQHRRPLRVARLTPEEWPLVWQLAEQLKPPPAPLADLLAPLWIQGQVIGSLEVVWEEGYSITTQEEQFLEAVAVQVALAITNARLYQEKERALQEAREQAKRLCQELPQRAVK